MIFMDYIDSKPNFMLYIGINFLYNSAQYCIVLYNPEKSSLFLVEAQKA